MFLLGGFAVNEYVNVINGICERGNKVWCFLLLLYYPTSKRTLKFPLFWLGKQKSQTQNLWHWEYILREGIPPHSCETFFVCDFFFLTKLPFDTTYTQIVELQGHVECRRDTITKHLFSCAIHYSTNRNDTEQRSNGYRKRSSLWHSSILWHSFSKSVQITI